MRLRWLQRGAAVLLGLSIALLAAEVFLRAQGVLPKQLNALRGFHRAHPTLGWLGEPNYQAVFERNGFRVQVQHDEYGFRQAQHGVQEWVEDAPRIAVLGDSYTWGWGVPQGAVFTDEWQRLLGPVARVRNFGVNAYGTAQQSLLLEKFVAPWQPDHVVLMVFGNDLHDNVDPKRGKRPYYAIENGQLVPRNQPVRRSIAGPARSLSRHSVAISNAHYLIGTRLARWKQRRRAHAAREAGAPYVEAAASPSLANPASATQRERLQASGAFTPENAEVFRALLGKLEAQCQALPTCPRLWVVYIPTPWETCAGTKNLIGEWVQSCAAEHQLPFLDLTPELHQAWLAAEPRGAEGQPVYLSGDEHWDQLGHRRVGATLHAWLAPQDL